MKCPFCEKEMENGFIQGARQFFYTTKKKRVLFLPSDDDIELSNNNCTSPTCIAYHCIECKKIIIDYNNSEE